MVDIFAGDLIKAWQAHQFYLLLNKTFFSPMQFGAVGDGFVDDTVAVKACLLASAQANGVPIDLGGFTYRITAQLFIWGNVSIYNGTLKLDANIGSGDYWINLGLPNLGSATIPYFGYFINVHFTATAKAGCQHFVNHFSCVNFGYINCVMDFTLATVNNVGSFGNQNNGAYTAGPVQRVNFQAIGCSLLWDQNAGGSEGLGAANCVGVRFIGCYTSGQGDDAIGIHSCDDVTIVGCRTATIQGHWFFSGCRRVVLEGNIYEVVAARDGTWHNSGGIATDLEGATQYACQQFSIKGNIFLLPSSVPAGGNFMRLAGLKDSVIEGNQLYNYTSGSTKDLTLTSATFAGWVDPDGIEIDDKARVRNVRVLDNDLVPPAGTFNFGGRVSVGVANAGLAPGPVFLHGNRATGFDLSFLPANGGGVHDNRVPGIPVDTQYNLDSQLALDDETLATWYRTAMTGGRNELSTREAGAGFSGSWYTVDTLWWTNLIVWVTTPQTAGNLRIRLLVNTVAILDVAGLTVTTSLALPSTNGSGNVIPSGATIDVQIITDGAFALGTGGDIGFELRGVTLRGY